MGDYKFNMIENNSKLSSISLFFTKIIIKMKIFKTVRKRWNCISWRVNGQMDESHADDTSLQQKH